MKKKIIIAAIGANLLIILFFWWQGSGTLLLKNSAGALYGIAKLCGLLSVYCVLLQFLLMSRARWLEGTFGLDKLAKIHKLNGKLAITFIILHVILMTTTYALTSKISFLNQLLSFITDYDDLLNALIAVILFLVIVGLSITIVRRNLKYEMWYYVHIFTYLAIILAWGHQLELGSDFAISQAFTIYWYALYIAVFGNVLFFRFATPIYRTLKHDFIVDEVIKESDTVTSIYIRGKNLESFNIKPGQFNIYRFLKAPYIWEAHPFSVSALPRSNRFRISAKASGDFTSTLPNLPVGTKVFVDGPYGVFTPDVVTKPKLLFIAGGIGITPIRTMIEYFSEKKSDMILLYANRYSSDVVFKDELEKISKIHPFPIYYAFSKDPKAKGIQGFFTQEVITKLVKDITQREVFLCGPPAMMQGMVVILKELGIPSEMIHFEEFSL